MGGLKTNLNRKIVTGTGRNGRARSGSGRWKGESEVVQYILAITRISVSPCILPLYTAAVQQILFVSWRFGNIIQAVALFIVQMASGGW